MGCRGKRFAEGDSNDFGKRRTSLIFRAMPVRELEIVVTDANLPEFWDRSIAFFANLLALFFGNEEETACLAHEVGEVDSYGGRLIPILNILFKGPDNVLILERRPDEALCDYFRDELRLSLPTLEILSHRDYVELGRKFADGEGETAGRILSSVSEHAAGWVDGYVTDKTLLRIARHLEKRTITTAEGSRCGNNKFLLHRYLEERGLPTVRTEMAVSREEIPRCLEALQKEGFRSAVLKAQIGASGIGMVKFPDVRPSAKWPEVAAHLFYEGPAMVQGWLEPGVHGVTRMRSPSVQMFLSEDMVYLFDMTEQILSEDSVHEGNESPPPYLGDGEREKRPGVREELLRQAGIAGEWLHRQGYRGTASADFILVERNGDEAAPEVYVCELNARVTGATYPSVLGRHLSPRGAWLMRNVRFQQSLEGARLLGMLEKPGHLYRRGSAAGVLPLNFNFGPDGLVHKGQFLCLGESPEECHAYLAVARSKLPVEWEYERD